MISYRALTHEDLDELKKYVNEIRCTIKHSYDADNKKCTYIYNKCFEEIDKDYILGLVYGHIHGGLVDVKRSPWISLTSDFNAAYKYATCEKKLKKRSYERDILCFEIDDEKVIRSCDEFNIEKFNSGSVIDLSNGQLADYRIKKIMQPLTVDKKENPKGKNFTLANYSKADKELIIFDKITLLKDSYVLIKKEDQKTLFDEFKINNYSDVDIQDTFKKMMKKR